MQERPPARPGSRVARTSSGWTTLMLAATSLILELATLVALLLDSCSLATILAALAALFGGLTVYRMASSSGDKPDPVYHDPPPTR